MARRPAKRSRDEIHADDGDDGLGAVGQLKTGSRRHGATGPPERPRGSNYDSPQDDG